MGLSSMRGRFPLGALAAKDGLRLRLVAVGEQPVAGIVTQARQRWTGGDHHPHRRLWIGRRLGGPLALGDQECAQGNGVTLA